MMAWLWFSLALVGWVWLVILYQAQAVDGAKAAQGFKSAADAIKAAFAKLRGR